MVDAADSKSVVLWAWGFKSLQGHQIIIVYMLKKVNFYHVITGDLVSSSAPILNTFFTAKFKILSICDDEELAIKCDAKLWTFASNLFIPHGLLTDLQPEIQPILFCTTDKIQNLNNANCVVLITNNLLQNIDSIKNLPNIEALVCIFVAHETETQNCMKKLGEFDAEKKYFTDLSGKWQEYNLLV